MYGTCIYISLIFSGGTAGAASLITEQLGQVVAAMSFDSEYKRVSWKHFIDKNEDWWNYNFYHKQKLFGCAGISCLKWQFNSWN